MTLFINHSWIHGITRCNLSSMKYRLSTWTHIPEQETCLLCFLVGSRGCWLLETLNLQDPLIHWSNDNNWLNREYSKESSLIMKSDGIVKDSILLSYEFDYGAGPRRLQPYSNEMKAAIRGKWPWSLFIQLLTSAIYDENNPNDIISFLNKFGRRSFSYKKLHSAL